MSDEYENGYVRENSISPNNNSIQEFEQQNSFYSDSGELLNDHDSGRFVPSIYESEGALDRSNSMGEYGSGRFDRSSSFMWEEEREKEETEASEVETMKERFAKLLLGEDMSGGSKGVCCALAISNAITNLSASVFGEKWKLAPISPMRKKMWRKEMEWLLCVSDHIVELVPAWHVTSDGLQREVMVTKQRADLHANLPALRKLDNMLLETLDSFKETEFWYEKPGSKNWDAGVAERHKDKWWLPMPRVPDGGLSPDARRHLNHQRDIASQVLKASMAINSQILLDMEIPDAYCDSLPKNAKLALGENLYRIITMDSCNAEQLLAHVDLSNEHTALEAANKFENATYIWRRRLSIKANNPLRDSKSRSNMGKLMRDFRGNDTSHCEEYADRSEAALLLLRQKFPGLPQTSLDGYKIQYNRDVGKSILESYSRVLESMASNIVSRIEDVLYAEKIHSHASSMNHRTNSAPPSVHRYSMPNLSLVISSNNHESSPDHAWESSPNYSPSPSQTPTSPLSVKSESSFRSRMWKRRPPGLPTPNRNTDVRSHSIGSHGEVALDAVLELARVGEGGGAPMMGISGGRSPPMRGIIRTKSVGLDLEDLNEERGRELKNGEQEFEEEEGMNMMQRVVLSPRRARSVSGPLTKEDIAKIALGG